VGTAVAYLETKDYEISKEAVKFVIDTINATLCEGAKRGCSLKVLSGAECGYNAAMFALDTKLEKEGIIEKDLQKTFKNLERIKNSMLNVDKEIVTIMKENVI
jgi:L-cysteine desulfidase